MSLDFQNNDAWIFSPYCFCTDRPWLSINELKDLEDVVIAGGGIRPIPGLSMEDTALLAALLTALAIFLFLLFLLLCLFCPCGLCCRKKSRCCSTASKSKKSGMTDLKESSASNSKNVNLTAVDMKIPRVWMDTDEGYSDSELDKRRKMWDDTFSSRWLKSEDKHGHGLHASKDDYFKHGGLLSTYDLANNYGGWYKDLNKKTRRDEGNKGREREMIALDEFYSGSAKTKTIPSSLKHKRNSYGSIVEKLMTPRTKLDFSSYCNNNTATNSFDNCVNGADAINYGYGYNGRYNHERQNQGVKTMEKREAMNSKDVLDATSKRDTTINTMNSEIETSLKNISGRAGNITQSLPFSGYDSRISSNEVQPLAVSHTTLNTLAMMDNTSDLFRGTDVRRETVNCNHNMTMERTSTYMKRVVEETETITNS